MLPPPTIEDEPNAADAARRRLQRKEHFFRLKSKSSKENKRKSKSTSNDDLTFDVLETGPDEADITLMKEPNALDDVTKDVYEWAIVYENQRGSVFAASFFHLCLNNIAILQNNGLFHPLLFSSISSSQRPLPFYHSVYLTFTLAPA